MCEGFVAIGFNNLFHAIIEAGICVDGVTAWSNGIGTNDDFCGIVIIDIGNDRIFPVCAGGIVLAIACVAGFAVIDAQEAFVCIYGFGFAVAIEVEDGGSCFS